MNPQQRYNAMAHNRGRTRPELALESALWKNGLRYLTTEGYKSKYGITLQGHPDLIFTRKRAVLFMDGCFWHGCQTCNRASQVSEYWKRKIEKNIQRDQLVTHTLEKRGWRLFRVPEHSINTKSKLMLTTRHLTEVLRSITL